MVVTSCITPTWTPTTPSPTYTFPYRTPLPHQHFPPPTTLPPSLNTIFTTIQGNMFKVVYNYHAQIKEIVFCLIIYNSEAFVIAFVYPPKKLIKLGHFHTQPKSIFLWRPTTHKQSIPNNVYYVQCAVSCGLDSLIYFYFNTK